MARFGFWGLFCGLVDSSTCQMNRLERRHQSWMDKKLEDQRAIEPPTNAVRDKFLKDVRLGKQILRAYGILGEKSGSDAYVDEVIKPDTGGTFLKLYGNSYLFPGAVPKESVNSLELIKFAAFQLTRESWFFSAYIAYLFIFRKRQLYWLLWEVDHRTIRHIEILAKEYCRTVEAVKKALAKALRDVFQVDLSKPFYPVDHPLFRPDRRYPQDKRHIRGNPLGWIIAFLSKFLSIFLELDTAYRFRVQDAFALLKDKRDLNEFFRILEILIGRETQSGVGFKWKFIRLVAKVAFLFQPKIKKFVVAVLRNLDTNEIRMTEADWYYSLGYRSYDFGGMPREQRYKIREELDRKKGHVFFFGDNVLD